MRRRDFSLIVFSTFFIPVVLFTGPLRDATGRSNWSCDAVLWFRLLCVPMGQIPLNLRLLRDYAKHDLNAAVARAKLKTMARAAAEANDGDAATDHSRLPIHPSMPESLKVNVQHSIPYIFFINWFCCQPDMTDLDNVSQTGSLRSSRFGGWR